MAGVEHPIDGGDADPGGAGKIGDGRAAQIKGSPDERNARLAVAMMMDSDRK
jgi:hypothetical protein